MGIGVFLPGLEPFPLEGLSASFTGISSQPGAYGLLEGEALSGGSVQDVRPLPAFPGVSYSVAKVSSFVDDFYNRIHFVPMQISFGPITSDISKGVVVWNAYLEQAVTLSGISIPDGQGLVVSGPARPAVFKPLESKSYTVTATAAGTSLLSANPVWSFDIPWQFSLPVSGTRLKLWDFEPNWGSASFQITYSFLTEIITSRSGREQRRALRLTPRKTVEYTSSLYRENFKAAKDAMWAWQSRAFVMPDRPRYLTSVGTLNAGNYTISVDRVPAEFGEGATVLLTDGETTEIRSIESVDEVAKTLTFNSTSGTTWPEGTRVYFGLVGYMNTSQGMPRLTNRVSEMPVVFNVDPVSEPYVTPPDPEVVFNDREVFLKKPNWAEQVDVTQEHDLDSVDYNRGAIVRFEPVLFGREIRKATFLGKTFDQAEDLRNLFFRMRGRRGEFYMPSWEYDIEPQFPVASSVAALRVPGYDLYDMYAASTVHRALSVQLRDGTYLLRKIVSIDKVSDSSGEATVISVDAVWGVALTAANVVMISWLYVRRFASDDLTIEWMTNRVAQTQLAMQTLEDLPPELPPS